MDTQCRQCCGENGRRRTSQEAVELDEQLEVDIVALGRFAVRTTHVVLVEVDTCTFGEVSAIVSLKLKGPSISSTAELLFPPGSNSFCQ